MFDLNTLDLDATRNAVDRLNKALRPHVFCGREVVELPVARTPKLKISPDCPVSDEFRAEMDAWLVGRFGYRDTSVFQPGRAYLFGNTIAMHPADVVRLRSVV